MADAAVARHRERASHAGTPPAVELRAVEKRFRRANGSTVTPLDSVSFEIAKGELLVLLGPSGCGKTTLLRCIAGLEHPDAGEVLIDGRPVFARGGRVNVPPERRGIGMIFQSYALWPHLTVRRNVAYPLKGSKLPKGEVERRTMDVLERVGVAEVADQLPGRLSGGQQQRVALARALVNQPSLILFDEPLSNVDAKVREELRLELLTMQRELGFTGVYVTHDQVEALELADRIAVFEAGRIAQAGSPRSIYSQPSSYYVARFIGRTNELSGVISAIGADGRATVSTVVGDIEAELRDGLHVGSPVRAVWRPETTSFSERAGFPARVRVVRFLGTFDEVVCATDDGTEVRVISVGTTLPVEGDLVQLVPRHVWAFPMDDGRHDT